MSENEKDTKEANPMDAQFGNWTEDFSEKKKEYRDNEKSKVEWMKFEKPGKYKVRLIGKYVRYLKHYKPFGKGVRIITHKDYKGEDPAWKAGFYPGDAYVIHIIDRADGKVKLLDKGRKLFECFFDYGTANNLDPAGKDAPNFEIKVEWPNGNKNLAKYSAVASGGPSLITKEEGEMLKEYKANHPSLGQIYRATPLDKIKAAWDAVPEQYRTPPKREDKDGTPAKDASAPAKEESKPAIEESMTSAPAESDDLFGDNKDKAKDEDTNW